MIKLDRSLIPKGEFYVAVSGGVDSIAAAHLLIRLYGDRVKVAHFNHNLRPQNRTMQEMVELFCHNFYTECVVGTRDSTAVKSNAENVLRESRLDFFKSLYSNVVCCHHNGDAVESYFMNMLRGCPEYVPVPTCTPLDNCKLIKPKMLIRPFMKTKKEDFINYALNNKLTSYIVEDETNKDSSYKRNWIRNEILPMLKQYGLPKIVAKKFYSTVNEL